MNRVPRHQKQRKQETTGSWKSCDAETLQRDHQSTGWWCGERPSVSVKETSWHSGSSCVTNLLVRCLRTSSLVGSRAGVHQSRGSRWSPASIPNAPDGKYNVIVDAHGLDHTGALEGDASQHCPLWLKGSSSA